MSGIDQVEQMNNEIRRFGDAVRGYREDIASVNSRMNAIEQELVAQGGIAPRSGARSGGMGSALRAAISDDASFEHLAAWNQASARVSMDGLGIRAALVTGPYDPAPSSNTDMPSQPERGGLVGPVIAQPRLLNFLRTRPVANDSVEFVQLSTTGDAGYQLGEGTEKPEVEFEGTARRAYIATIAGHTTASRQVLNDNAALGSLIDGVLRRKLMNRLSYEIINGQGGGGDTLRIEGLLKQGVTMTLPTAATYADRIGEAAVRQGNLGFQPALIVCNPLDWFTEIGTAKTAQEAAYLFGSPASPIPPALWNLPVALEPALLQGYSLVLDLNYITVLDRERANVLLSNTHKDYFTRNLVSILGELRAGLELLDAGAVFIVEPSSV